MPGRVEDSVEAQIERLRDGMRALGVAMEALPQDAFLGPLGRWTPRDVVAHLIGWTRYTVLGAQQILRGELPFYDADPGEDYSHVNARLIAEYSSRNRVDLLTTHAQAATELEEYLRSIPADDWRRRTGVHFGGEELTVRQNVDELIEDHHHHAEQIRGLTESLGVSS